MNWTESDFKLVTLANDIMLEAHAGHFRRDGVTPYRHHPEAVAKSLLGQSGVVVAVALLHDTMEDAPDFTPDVLLMRGIPKQIIDILQILTHPKYTDYFAYIHKVKTNPIATMVKLADIQHNLSDAPSQRQIEKYAKAVDILIH
jgi:(p)ppGpp synthase/HD superfamily hydrolase